MIPNLGSPPAWTPLSTSRRLQEDKGDFFRDPNAARFPTYPLEPAVRALLMGNQSLTTQSIDLFACSSTLGSLLRFVRRVEKPFRFFVESVGNTVFFNRHENSPKELIAGVRGYGHTFPEAYTTWDASVKGSASHQRLLRYEFAGLDCIIRFECDGYLKSSVSDAANELALERTPKDAEETDNITAMMDSVTMTSLSTGSEMPDVVLNVKKRGRMIPQDVVFDLKTRSSWKKGLNVLEEELPRYWAAQIPNFILAHHESGVFNDIQVLNIENDVKRWEQQNQVAIRRLCWLIHKIMAVTKAREDGKLEVCWKSLETLELREQDTDGHDVLPLALRLRWEELDQADESHYESEEDFDGGVPLPDAKTYANSGSNCGENVEEDYTACSPDGCGYCGRCSY